MRPLIGIPCFSIPRAGDGRLVNGNNPSYVRAIEDAGGAPMLIPPLVEMASMQAIYACLDGLLLSGGGDVEPSYYGEAPLPQTDAPDRPRDLLEVTYTRQAIEDGTPLLGICRGIQVLNVAVGGGLYQDIPTQCPRAQRHMQAEHPRDYRAHDISIDPDSRLATILGTVHHNVNSLHHQAVSRPGRDVRIVARAPDRIAEGMEIAGHPFAIAVQFHPEELVPADEASRRLFRAFIDAAREHLLARRAQPAASAPVFHAY